MADGRDVLGASLRNVLQVSDAESLNILLTKERERAARVAVPLK